MPKTLQFRRGTTTSLAAQTGAEGELFVDTTKDTVVVMDGATAGGFPLAKESALSAKISITDLSATTPIVYNNTTGAFTHATSGVSASSYGSAGGGSVYVPRITVNASGHITAVSEQYQAISSGGNSFGTIYVGATGSPPTGGTIVSADTSNDSLYLIAGTGITFSANINDDSITINSSGGSAGGVTWNSNTSPGGSITVTNPTGYSTGASTMVIVVVGSMVSGMSSSSLISGSSTWSELYGNSNIRVFYTMTGFSPGATTSIGGISGYAMAYAYISTSSSSMFTSTTSASSTSTSLSNPTGSNNPRIVGVSTSSSLNLATVAGPATGGGPTWASGSGFAHPLDSSLSAAVWVGTGSWTNFATPTLTSNSGGYTWYVTGIAGS